MNQTYFKEVGAIKALTREEQNALVVRAKAGDERAKERLISSHLRLVIHYAKGLEKYLAKNGSLTIDDLICEGNIALIDAVNHHNPSSGATLSYFAGVVIKRRIMSFISNNNSSIRIPERKLKELLKHDKLEDSPNFEQEPRENKYHLPTKVNLFEFEDNNEDDENNKEMWEKIHLALKTLKAREREIIEMYYGLNDHIKRTQFEISTRLGLSKVRVGQIIKSVIINLKKSFEFRD
ncbi:sigma-70 family RNA polymerase sigma factor [Flavobacterium sp.]|uniref:sigma-70 family RNA polymerase sigma factor n=1 Tax=Flavobacterium sp. TaxID=239 RepID=UPI004033F441